MHYLCNFNGFVIGPDNPFTDESTNIETPGEEPEVDLVKGKVVTLLDCGHIVHPSCNEGLMKCRLKKKKKKKKKNEFS